MFASVPSGPGSRRKDLRPKQETSTPAAVTPAGAPHTNRDSAVEKKSWQMASPPPITITTMTDAEVQLSSSERGTSGLEGLNFPRLCIYFPRRDAQSSLLSPRCSRNISRKRAILLATPVLPLGKSYEFAGGWLSCRVISGIASFRCYIHLFSTLWYLKERPALHVFSRLHKKQYQLLVRGLAHSSPAKAESGKAIFRMYKLQYVGSREGTPRPPPEIGRTQSR